MRFLRFTEKNLCGKFPETEARDKKKINVRYIERDCHWLFGSKFKINEMFIII